MRRRSPKSWLVLMIGMSGCATPILSDSMTALPYPGAATTAPAQPQMATKWTTPPWDGAPAQTVRTAAYNGETPIAPTPGMPATQPCTVCDGSDPCAETRAATRPVRRFLHNMFCPESTRLAPTPIPTDQMILRQVQVPVGYHLRPGAEMPGANSGIITADVRTMPTSTPMAPEVVTAGPALVPPTSPQTEVLHTTFAEVAPKAESVGPQMLPPATPRPGESADAPPGPPIHLVCERSIRLNCKLRDVGPSGLSAVEVWYTQDAKHWLKAEHTCPPQPPYTMDVKDDGRYGITLIARNGLGIAKAAPVLGEAPQVWVEVDTTHPTVQVGKVQFRGVEGARELAISWSASDKNLGPKSIKLAYAEKAQGPWQPIADVDNTGAYTWRLPAKMPTSFFIQVQATDTAGNTTTAAATEPVVLDMSRPTVEILSVEAVHRR